MEEAAVADHVVIINKGKIVAEGTPAELKAKHSYDRLKLVPNDKKKLVDYLDSIKRTYNKVSDEYIVTVTDAKDAISLLEALKDNIKQFEVIKGSMDDVFIEVIGSELHV